jgi:YfiH family protein
VRLEPPFARAGEHIAVELPHARAVFTTRRGGHSTGPYESLNFGLLTDDDHDHVRRNRQTLADQLGVRFAYIRQVHGTTVARISEPSDGPRMEADAQVTAAPGVAPMVMTADCLPIAVAGGGAVAVIHAGWRGLAGGVIGKAVEALREAASDVDGELVAAIGPGAGPCCYEVGDEVHAEFAAHGASARRRRNLDLQSIARAQLEAAGATAVHDVGLCTICSDPTLFFSHRRDRGITGRQAGVVWLT